MKLFKNILGLIILWVMIFALTVSILTNNKKVEPQQPNNIIDSLNNSIDSLQNCIDNAKSRVDTIYVCKTIVKHIYEKKEDSIWNYTADDDWKYYNQFLSTRFPSDSASTEAN